MAGSLAKYCSIYGAGTLLVAAAPEYRRTPYAGSQSSQFFARGFELNLGTDFALEFGGIPLNTPSHVHGAGYLDQDLVIPDLVDGYQYAKGSYQAEQGGFAVAGSAAMTMVKALPAPICSFTYGGARTDRYGRFLWAETLPEPKVTYALELTRNERPWNDLVGSARANGAFRLDGGGPRRAWSFTVLGSVDKSDAGGATPVRAYPEGVDVTMDDAKAGDGSWSRRLLLGWSLDREDAPGVTTRVRAFAGGHNQRLWNNWTYFLRDENNGDQTEQVDRRVFLGGNGARTWVQPAGPMEWTHTLGLEGRFDRVSAADEFPTQDRERLAGPLRSARAALFHGAVFGQSSVLWAQGWEAHLGLRLDAQVNRTSGVSGAWTPQDRGQLLGSPKAGLSYSPAEGTTFALQAGQGFRLGDAFRETQPMVRARSVDLSAQTRPLRPWTTSVTLWNLDLATETLFGPAANAFMPQGPARHHGLEFYNQIKQGPWSWELAWGWNQARFKNEPAGQDHVPGSVPHTAYAGVGWKQGRTSADLRLRRTGVRPLTGDNAFTAQRQDAMDVRVQQDWASWSVAVEVLNAFNKKTYNREYYYASRFPGETGPTLDRNLKPADPQAIRLEVRRRF